jgi:hypothetical protein
MRLRLAHRARRFARTITVRRPNATESAWVQSVLTPAEYSVFSKMSVADRVHSIDVARSVEASLGRLGLTPEATEARWILAAALTHDVGKTVSGLGTYGRVVATLSGAAAGTSMADAWTQRRGMTRRIGLYLKYPELGSDLLLIAGVDPRVAAWAAEHHEPEESWSVPVEVGRILVEADDE